MPRRNLNTTLILEMERRVRELPPFARLPVRPYRSRHLRIMAEARRLSKPPPAPLSYDEEIQTLCAIAGCPDRAQTFLEARLSIDDVRRQLVNAAAAESDGVHLVTRRPFEPAPPPTPTNGIEQMAAIIEQNRNEGSRS